MPYDSGLAFVRDPEPLRAAMGVTAAYLPDSMMREPAAHAPELSRRARGVEVWAVLRALGRSGLADLVERDCRHAAAFAQGLAAAGFEILNDVVLNQVLVSFGDEETTRRVVAAIQEDGTCWAGVTVWQGRTAMRISVSGWSTTEDDVERSLAAMLRAARVSAASGVRPMERRRIGVLEVSLAGLGTNNFGRRLDAAATREVVAAALDAGVTHFDTADIYGEGRSEEYLGRALGARRDEVTIASKFGYHGPPRGGGRQADWVPQALEASLRRLGTDRLDLLYYHKPDPGTSLLETLEVMNGLLERGLVREIGCSNFSAAQLDEAAAVAAEQGLRGFAVVENEYSLLEREPEGDDGAPERGVLGAAERLGMAFVPYYPARLRTAERRLPARRPTPRGSRLGGDGRPAEEVIDGDQLDVVERLAVYAEARGHTLLELALSYLAAHAPVASVIAGATSPAQVRANAAATGAWALTPELAEVGRCDRGGPRRVTR